MDLIKSENEEGRNSSPCFWKWVLWACGEVYWSKWNHLVLLCCRSWLNKFEYSVSQAVTYTAIISYVLFYWVKILSMFLIDKDIVKSRSRQRILLLSSSRLRAFDEVVFSLQQAFRGNLINELIRPVSYLWREKRLMGSQNPVFCCSVCDAAQARVLLAFSLQSWSLTYRMEERTTWTFSEAKLLTCVSVTLVLEAQVIENETFNRQAYKLDSSETNYSCTSLIESGGGMNTIMSLSSSDFIKNAKLFFKTGNSRNSLPQTPI